MTYLTAARARYAGDAAATASPARLLTMLYDRLVLDLNRAEQALREGDVPGAGEQISHAQDIVLELHATLDTKAWPGGEALARLYLWMVSELLQAGLKQDPDRVAAVRQLIEPLREAWRQAAVSTTAAAGPASA